LLKLPLAPPGCAQMTWDTRLYQWLQPRLKPSRTEKWFRWFYGDDIEECVGSVFSQENFPGDDAVSLEARRLKWASLLRRFQKYGHYSTGNRVNTLEGGDACYSCMLDEINAARTRVWCESYIFDNSLVAQLFVESLCRAAERGCDVLLLVDYIGSFSLRADWTEDLRRSGVEVAFFNSVLPSSACVGPISFRDHRKILICDEVGFCGGMNVQEEVGEERFGSGRFYDVHARLEGPCVYDLAEVLRDSLRESGSQVVRGPIPVPERLPGGVYVQILQSNVRQRRRTLQKVIERSLDAADSSVFLTTAYFFPPGFLRRALLRVPSRGATLSLLLSGSSDFYPIPGDLMAQTYFLYSFLRETQRHQDKVAVHLYEARHMHAKHMSIDGVFSTIGSFNFDLYSARRNLEVGVSVFDAAFARNLQALHENKARESRRTCLDDRVYQQPLVRAACAIAHGIIRFSGRNFFDGLDCFQRKWLVRKAALTFLLEEQAAQFVATSMMWGLGG